MQLRKPVDPLKKIRIQIRKEIESKYPTIEKFCFENEIEKSILSRFLSGKQKDFRVNTLNRIAEGLGKSLDIRLK